MDPRWPPQERKENAGHGPSIHLFSLYLAHRGVWAMKSMPGIIRAWMVPKPIIPTKRWAKEPGVMSRQHETGKLARHHVPNVYLNPESSGCLQRSPMNCGFQSHWVTLLHPNHPIHYSWCQVDTDEWGSPMVKAGRRGTWHWQPPILPMATPRADTWWKLGPLGLMYGSNLGARIFLAGNKGGYTKIWINWCLALESKSRSCKSIKSRLMWLVSLPACLPQWVAISKPQQKK